MSEYYIKQLRKYILVILLAAVVLTGITAGVNAQAAACRISKSSVKLVTGKKIKLNIITKSKKDRPKVVWSSSDKKVASVNSKGVVKGRKSGKAKITAKVGKKKYVCRVRVNAPKKTEEEIKSTPEPETVTFRPEITTSSINVAAQTAAPAERIIIHRGKRSSAPENSIEAVEYAIQNGYNYVEIDSRFTADNVPVVIHNGMIDKNSNGAGSVANLTYDELRQYDFNPGKGKVNYCMRIPLLEEMVAFCKIKNCNLYLEIKDGMLTAEQALIIYNIIKKYDMFSRISIISFSQDSLEELIRIMPGCRYGLLVSNVSSPDNITKLQELKKIAGSEVFLDTDVNNPYFTAEAVNAVKAAGFNVEGWTYPNVLYIRPEHRGLLSGFTCDL